MKTPLFKISLALSVAFISFYFRVASAQLPVEAGLGQACNASTPCDGRFFCSGGKCVQCGNDADCDQTLNESCVSGVCTLPNGNNAGDLCVGNSNCKSGFKCGARGICEEAGGSTHKTCVGPVCRVVSGAGADECSNDVACGGGSGGGGEGGGGGTGGENWMGVDLTVQNLADIISGLACWLTRIAMAVMVIFIILAGLRFMYARGNPTAYQAAVKNFQHVLIGCLVILGVYVIIATIANAVGVTNFSLIPLVC